MMTIQGWRYYNYAALPTTAPHEVVDISPIKDGSIWRMPEGVPLLARWTSEFDCSEETEWWYVIKDTPFDIAALNSKRRYEINKGCKNFEVRVIDPCDYAREIYDVDTKAYSTYSAKYAPKRLEIKDFVENMKSWKKYRIYGAFSNKNGSLCGYVRTSIHEGYIDFMNLKVDPAEEKKAINAALVYGMLIDSNEFLSAGGYICDGERNVLHETKFGDYLEKYFGFRKVFCHLHLTYSPRIYKLVKIAYPLRKVFYALRKNKLCNYASSILKMEEIVRRQKD